MSDNNKPLSPEEVARTAQQTAMKEAMEQAQALYGSIPRFQMPDMLEAQEQLMKEAAAIPGVAEAYAYQAEMMKQAGIDPETMQEAYRQNLGTARQMMQQAMNGIVSDPDGYLESLGMDTDDGWEIMKSEDGCLSPEQLRLLAFGAPLCIYNGDFVDSIESTTDADTLKEMLEEWWEVTDPKSALETIAWLFNAGQHQDADPALAEIRKRGVNGISEEERCDEENKIGDVCTIAEFVIEAKEATIDILPKTIIAWDLVRAVNVARWAFLCGYMKENEMWQTAKTVADKAKKIFNSWEEYGLSFAVGRGVWQGDPEDYETADEVVSTLLENEESPWKQIEW